MALRDDLVTFLLTQTGLTALVGRRIFPLVLPQKAARPAVVYEETANNRSHAMQSDTGMPQMPLYTFHIFAATFDETLAVEAQLITALQDKTGTMVSTTLHRIRLDNSYDGDYEEKTGTYHRVVDFTIRHA